MNSKAMGLSLFFAGIAVYFVMSSVSTIEDEARMKFGNEVTVLIAKEDIKEMDTITESVIETKNVPSNFVQPSAVNFQENLDRRPEDEKARAFRDGLRDVVGNVAMVPIKKGEQITLNKITIPSLRTGLSPQITPGKRAFTVPVDEVSSVGKLIKPGDRIDLIASVEMSQNGQANSRVAKTILQDVVVLAVGRNVTNNIPRKIDFDGGAKPRVRSLTEYDGYSSITIEVDPQSTVMLSSLISVSSTRIFFSLRNNDDSDRQNLPLMRPLDALNVPNDGQRFPATGSGTSPGSLPGGGRP